MSCQIDTSWIKLDSLLKETTFTPKKRPVSAKNQRRRTLSNGLNRTFDTNRLSLQTTRFTRQSINSVTVRPTAKQIIGIEGVRMEDLQLLYKRKCADMKIPFHQDQEKRFLTYCFFYLKKRVFDMKENNLGLGSAKVIASIISHNNCYSRLILCKNPLGDQGAAYIVSHLMQNHCLVHLDISSCNITPKGFIPILNHLRKHVSIQSLCIGSYEGLHRNRLAKDGAIMIRELLLQNEIIFHLNLQGTGIDDKCISLISQGLKYNKVLKSLVLSNNPIGTSIYKLSKIIHKSGIIELDLSNTDIGDKGSEAISLSLEANFGKYPTLCRLNLSSNGIQSQGVARIFQSIRLNGYLQELNLMKNPLGSRGIGSISNVLMDNHLLRKLNLGWCELGSEGAAIIANFIGYNKGLQSLYLNNNFITDSVISQISQALIKNQALRVLDLSGNKVSTKGAINLAQMLKSNQCIRVLNLKDNNILDEGGKMLSEVARFNHNIVALRLETNPLNYGIVKEIKGFIQQNLKIQKKSIQPKLEEIVDKLQLPDNAIEKVNKKVKKTSILLKKQNRKFEKQTENFKKTKLSQSQKFEELQDQLQKIQVENNIKEDKISHLEEKAKRVEFQGQCEVQKWKDKIAIAVSDIKQLQKTSNFYIEKQKKEELALKKLNYQNLLEELQNSLEKVQKHKSRLIKINNALNENIAKSQQQVEHFKKAKTEVEYLASEKLAETKGGRRSQRRKKSLKK